MSRSRRSEWLKRVERWRDSGLTAKEFAAETGLNASTLSYWKWRLGLEQRATTGTAGPSKKAIGAKVKRSRPAPTSIATFAELPPMSTLNAEPLELALEGAPVRVRVPVGFDEETLVRVLRVLGAGR